MEKEKRRRRTGRIKWVSWRTVEAEEGKTRGDEMRGRR